MTRDPQSERGRVHRTMMPGGRQEREDRPTTFGVLTGGIHLCIEQYTIPCGQQVEGYLGFGRSVHKGKLWAVRVYSAQTGGRHDGFELSHPFKHVKVVMLKGLKITFPQSLFLGPALCLEPIIIVLVLHIRRKKC